MPSLLYVYNMLPVIGAGDRFTDISIVPHPKGFRKVVEKVLQLRKGPLCEGTPAKRVGERPYLAAFYENVSPSVSFADSAPPLALRATSPVSGESVSQREPFASFFLFLASLYCTLYGAKFQLIWQGFTSLTQTSPATAHAPASQCRAASGRAWLPI